MTPNRDLVRRAKVFADLSDAECDAVGAVFKPMKVAAGGTLFKEGDPGAAMLLVVQGTLAVKVKTPAGTEENVRKVGPGDTLGELSFFDAKPRSATVTALENAGLFAFTREAMRTLRAEQPRVASAIYRGILKDITHRLRDLADKSIEGIVVSREIANESSTLGRPGAAVTSAQLAKVPSLQKYAPEDLEMLAKLCTYRQFLSGEVLMEQDKRGHACWLLTTGQVVATNNTQATPLATLGPGALLGQLALLDGTVRSATVTAKTPTGALEIHGTAFRKLLLEHSPLALRFQEQVALAGVNQVRTATNRFATLAGERAEAASGASRTLDWDEDGMNDIPLELDTSRTSMKR